MRPLQSGRSGRGRVRGRGRRREAAVELRIVRGRREAHGRTRGRVAHVPARGAAARPLAHHTASSSWHTFPPHPTWKLYSNVILICKKKKKTNYVFNIKSNHMFGNRKIIEIYSTLNFLPSNNRL